MLAFPRLAAGRADTALVPPPKRAQAPAKGAVHGSAASKMQGFWCAASPSRFSLPRDEFHPLRNGFTYHHLDLAPVTGQARASKQELL